MSEGIREILNEGRVVGLSAYELYVRRLIESDPSATPPSEKAWLASMFGNGSAMVLKISSGTQAGVQDFALPADSILCGANTLLASVFNGECSWSENTAVSDTGAVGYWATSVTSYGGLIENTEDSHPTSSDIPYSSGVFDNDSAKLNVANYCKIADGIVLQQGTWVHDGSVDAPYSDLTDPELGLFPTIIRLYITKDLTNDVKIIFTGFLDSEFASSLAGLDGSINPELNGAANGEFLGPAIYPWSSKILFIYPNIANVYIDDYSRVAPYGTLDSTEIGSYSFDGQDSDVNVVSVIDLDTVDPNAYYQVNSLKYGSSTIPVDVTEADTAMDGFNVLAVMEPGMTVDKANAAYAAQDPDAKFFPPALYALKTSAEGLNNYVPVDTAAPGTVKMFDTASEAYEYAKQVPNAYAFFWDTSDNTLKLYDSTAATVADGYAINTQISVNAPKATIATGGVTLKTIALSNAAGTDVPTTGSSGVITVTGNGATDGLSWDNILDALSQNKKLDVLGQAIKDLRATLPNINLPTGDITCNNLYANTKVQTPLVRVGDDNKHADITYDTVNNRLNIAGDVNISGRTIDNSIVTKTFSGTTVTVNDDSFTANGIYDIYTSVWGVNPYAVTANNGSVKLDFRTSQTNLTVGVALRR